MNESERNNLFNAEAAMRELRAERNAMQRRAETAESDWQTAEAELARVHQPEICICAAVRLADGRIIRGHRHNDCHRTMWDMTPRPSDQGEQGFLTTRNRFVDRMEGLDLQQRAGIESARGYYQQELYSEDLY